MSRPVGFPTPSVGMLVIVLALAIGLPLTTGRSPLNWLSILFLAVYAVIWTLGYITKVGRRPKD